MRVTKEEYREAYLIWKEENPETTSVPRSTIVMLPNGKKVFLGKKIDTMKCIYRAMQEGKHYGEHRDLTEDEIVWWTEHGLNFSERKRMTYTEEEYREAYLIWKKENPKSTSVPSTLVVELLSGKQVPLGNRINTMKCIYRAMQEGKHYGAYRDLTEDEITWWTEQGIELRGTLIKNEEEYREAYLIWKEENPEKETVPILTVIELPNGKKVFLGKKIDTMKCIYRAMQKGEHYGKNRDLTEEQIAWWTEHGVNLEKSLRQTFSEEEYREAYLIWKKENPKAKSVPSNLVVTLLNGKQVPLGNKIKKIKSIYKAMQEGKHYGEYRDLTEDEISWWKEQGLDLERQHKKHHSKKQQKNCAMPKKELQKEKKALNPIVENSPVEKKQENKKKTSFKKQKSSLSEQTEVKKNKYQEAYLLWKKENPKETSVPKSTIVVLPNRKKVSLGKRIDTMKSIYNAMKRGNHYGDYKDLTEEEIIWWEEHGVDLSERRTFRCTEEEYREAYLLWKKENPKEKSIPFNLVVTLPNRIKVPLGNRINTMKSIYHAMQKGEHYGKNSDLTEDEISWWTEHGINFEKAGLLRRDTKNAWIIKNLLSEFHVDFKEFIKSLEPSRTNNKKTEKFNENIEEQTLKKLCLQGGYSYKIVSSAIKLHSFLPNETLEQLINRMLLRKQNKTEISSWIFEVYGSMIEGVLLELNLNPKQVFKYMSENIIPLEEAICHQIFSSTCKNEECDYLEDIYSKILVRIDFQKTEEENAEKIVNQIVKIGKRNHLMDEEISVLIECFKSYIQTMREYQIIDVGLEVNEEEKFRKIQEYNLTEEEIEESYFVPFHFEDGILLGEKSELYKRRELLRQYIIDWDYYTEDEKESAKEEHHFTNEEISIMEGTRIKINQTIKEMQKVKSK